MPVFTAETGTEPSILASWEEVWLRPENQINCVAFLLPQQRKGFSGLAWPQSWLTFGWIKHAE